MNISEKIKKLKKEGKPHNQAVAIAIAMSKAAAKKKMRKK